MDKPISILHLEDSSLDAQLVQAVLKSGQLVCQINRVQTRDEYSKALQQGGFDIILGDYNLPGYDGISALRLAQKQCPDIPFIFVTGMMGEDAAIDSLTEGAVDYVLKHKFSRLVPAVKRALQEAENRLERKRAMLDLRKSEEQYRVLTEAMKDVVWILDIETLYFRYVSPSVFAMRGFTVEEVMSAPVDAALTPEASAYLTGLIRQRGQDFITGKEPPEKFYTDEVEQPCKDGTSIWVEVITNLYLNPENGRLEMRGVTRDISERKQAEAALHAEKSFADIMIASLPGILYVTDPQGRFSRWNDTFKETLGYSDEEIRYLTAPEIIHPDDQEQILGKVAEVFEKGRGEIEARLVTKDGRTRYYFLTGRRMEIGQEVYLVGMGTDLTERKQAEEALQKRVTQLALINEVGRKIASELDLPKLLAMATDLIWDAFHYDSVAIFMLERERAELVLKAKAGELAQRLPSEYSVPLGQGVVGWVGRFGEKIWSNDVRSEPRYQNEFSNRLCAQSELGLPLYAAQQMVGVVDIQSLQCNAFDENDVKVLETLVNQIAIAIHTVRLYEAVKKELFVRKWVEDELRVHRDHLEEVVKNRTFELESKNLLLEGEVAEQKRSDQILRKSDERLNLVFAGTGFGWWDWDCKTGEVFTHSNKWKMLGYSMEDVTPMIEWWQSLLHPEDRERVIATLDRHLRGESDAYDVEYRLRTQSGEWRWVSDRGKVVLKDANQNPLRISGTTQDITERKIALDELLREKFLSETTINSLPGSFYMVDERFRIVRWNRNMEIDSGYSGAELGQLNPFALIAWEDRKRTARSITQLMSEGSYSVEAEIVTKAGQRIPYYLSGNLMKFDGKKYVIGTGIDISQRKQLEEDLKQAKEAAETANRAKSTFLTNLSHEIRTPMNAILGFSQLMLRDPSITALQRQHLNTINRSGDHLMALVNDVLELSKIEAGRMEFKPSVFRLSELIDDLEVIFRLQTDEKHLTFRIEKEPALPDYVMADANKLRQIFINLLANSVKFTLTGGITWRIRSEAGEAGCLHLLSEIEDTGPGMDAVELARLFHPFEQTSSGEHSGSGTGLGLNISREFAQRMGGDICVTSQLGKGSVFHLEVTICQASPDRPNPGREQRKVIGLQPGQGPYRVLVADDQEDNRILLVEMLQMVGFETRQAATAEEAMSIFQSWIPHLILVEINMPVPPHYRARMDRSTGTQMIAVTTSAFENDRVQILETGFAGYVRKPFKEGELFEAIADCLGVEYTYQAEDDQDTLPENPASSATGGDELSALPVEWLEKLEHAIISANLKQLVSLIDQYAPAMPHAAGRLRELAENYRYEQLLDLLRQRRT